MTTTKQPLCPIDGRKSFYGKAHIVTTAEGHRFCKSYGTIVCGIVNGKLERYWKGYSATTMRHINAFIDTCGVSGGGKAWWNSLPVCKNEIAKGL